MVTFANLENKVTTTTTTATIKRPAKSTGAQQPPRMSTDDEAKLKGLQASNDFLKTMIDTTTDPAAKEKYKKQIEANNEEIKQIKAKYGLASADFPPAPEGCKDLYVA